MTENEMAKVVVDAANNVHRTLGGPGLRETVYEEAHAFEIESRGLTVVRQNAVPLVYKSKRLASDLRLDLLVGDRVIVELSARRWPPTTECSRRRLSPTCGCPISSSRMSSNSARQGIHRVVNGSQD